MTSLKNFIDTMREDHGYTEKTLYDDLRRGGIIPTSFPIFQKKVMDGRMKMQEFQRICHFLGYDIYLVPQNEKKGTLDANTEVGGLVLSMLGSEKRKVADILVDFNEKAGAKSTAASFRGKIREDRFRFDEITVIAELLSYKIKVRKNEDAVEPQEDESISRPTKIVAPVKWVDLMLKKRDYSLEELRRRYNEETGSSYVRQSFNWKINNTNLNATEFQIICYVLGFSMHIIDLVTPGHSVEYVQGKYGFDIPRTVNVMLASRGENKTELHRRLQEDAGYKSSRTSLSKKISHGTVHITELQACCGILGYQLVIVDDKE